MIRRGGALGSELETNRVEWGGCSSAGGETHCEVWYISCSSFR